MAGSVKKNHPTSERNLAELLCELGQALRRPMHRWAGTEVTLACLRPLQTCRQLALGFVTLRGSVQLRALVEDWPVHRIQKAIGARLVEIAPSQKLRPMSLGYYGHGLPGG